MSSQLGRILISGSGATADEMSARPDPDGGYGPLDAILAQLAAQAGKHPRDRGESPA
jgi:hypothetical protein